MESYNWSCFFETTCQQERARGLSQLHFQRIFRWAVCPAWGDLSRSWKRFQMIFMRRFKILFNVATMTCPHHPQSGSANRTSCSWSTNPPNCSWNTWLRWLQPGREEWRGWLICFKSSRGSELLSPSSIAGRSSITCSESMAGRRTMGSCQRMPWSGSSCLRVSRSVCPLRCRSYWLDCDQKRDFNGREEEKRDSKGIQHFHYQIPGRKECSPQAE